MKKINIILLFVVSISLTIACKKESSKREKFDIKNYAIHHLYRETDGMGSKLEGPKQMLVFKHNTNNLLVIKHVGTLGFADIPENISSFTISDNFYSNTDSLLIKINTTNLEAEVSDKNGNKNLALESNLIDVREKNFDVHGLILKGNISTYDYSGTLLENSLQYIGFSQNGSGTTGFLDTPPNALTLIQISASVDSTTNYYREYTSGGSKSQERLLFVFLKNKVILTGFYIDLVAHKTYHYYGELMKYN